MSSLSWLVGVAWGLVHILAFIDLGKTCFFVMNGSIKGMLCHAITDMRHTHIHIYTQKLFQSTGFVDWKHHTIGFGAMGGFLGTYIAFRHGCVSDRPALCGCVDGDYLGIGIDTNCHVFCSSFVMLLLP